MNDQTAVPPRGARGVILVVEDEADHARIITKALERAGYGGETVQWAENGQVAIDYLAQALDEDGTRLPRLVLLDVKMPRKNGFEVLEEVRGRAAYRRIPIVMLTTTSDADDIARALERGANDYVVKPISAREFMEKVQMIDTYWGITSDITNRDAG